MTFWVLALSYWVHLLATVVWLGGLATMAIIAWPALRKGTLDQNQWMALQRRLYPWINVSLVLLLVTGFVQMTNDEHYTGFLRVDSVWSGALLAKHVAIIGIMLATFYGQFRLMPAMERAQLRAQLRPELAAQEQAMLSRREFRLLQVNLLLALMILLLTAVATAV